MKKQKRRGNCHIRAILSSEKPEASLTSEFRGVRGGRA